MSSRVTKHHENKDKSRLQTECREMLQISAPKSKNAVSTNIKLSRYIHLMSNFSSIDFNRLLITSGIFNDKKKYYACDLKCRY